MFEHLFGSKTRVKLLSLFFNNTGRPYYVREITRKIDEQINSVRRELANLLSIGLIKSDSSNNRLYYEVNQEYQFYQELRRIFTAMPAKQEDEVMPETREEDHILKGLRTAGTAQLVILTGRYVREDRIPVDMLIVGDLNRSKLSKVIAQFEKEDGREINFTVFTADDYMYRLTLNDRFLVTVLDSRKIILVDELHNSDMIYKKAGDPYADQPDEVHANAEPEETSYEFDE